MRAKLVYIEAGPYLHRAAYLTLSTEGENDTQAKILGECEGIAGEVFLAVLNGTNVMSSDPKHWGNLPLEFAHQEITEKFDSLVDGQVIDALPAYQAYVAKKAAEEKEAAARAAAK